MNCGTVARRRDSQPLVYWRIVGVVADVHRVRVRGCGRDCGAHWKMTAADSRYIAVNYVR